MNRRIPDDDRYFIFGALPVVVNYMQTLGDKITKEITFKQWYLLLVIKGMPMNSSITEIAVQYGSSRQNIKRMLDSLKKLGYVKMEQNPKDSRVYNVDLTKQGNEILNEINKVGSKFVEDTFDEISLDDLSKVKEVFLKVIENLFNMEDKVYER